MLIFGKAKRLLISFFYFIFPEFDINQKVVKTFFFTLDLCELALIKLD